MPRLTELQLATAEALDAADGLCEAMLAASTLLQHCTCQARRHVQAMAAVELADSATARWEAAKLRIYQITMENRAAKGRSVQ